ncbi:WYL domain-containing protein, partial [Xanthomonas perforans]
RDRATLRLDYRRHSGTAITRSVEPALLVNYGRRWYLLVWDCERQDWRSLRADRIDQAVATGARFAPRALPEEPLQLLRKAIGEAPFPCRARVRLAGTVEASPPAIPPCWGPSQPGVPAHCGRGRGPPPTPARAPPLCLRPLPSDRIAPAQARRTLTQALDTLRTQLDRLPQ